MVNEKKSYISVEYSMGSKVSIEGDMYNFGIFLLEMFTRKRPIDSNFDDTMNLNQLGKIAFCEKIMEIVEHSLITEEELEEATSSSNITRQTRRGKMQNQCVISMFSIGLKCLEESPSERMKIKDALKELLAIKNMLLRD